MVSEGLLTTATISGITAIATTKTIAIARPVLASMMIEEMGDR